MKEKTMKLASLITIFLFTFGIVSAQTNPKDSVKPPGAKTETVVIQVPTIVCNSCVNTVTKAIKKVQGVKSTQVDLKKKTATVSFASAKTNLSKIELAIANAGYDANKTKRNPEAYEKLDACCKIDSNKK